MLFSQEACPDARGSVRPVNGRRRAGLASERGQALLETAVTLPLVLLVSVSIFEFGRAYQTSQVLTNAAREGARIAILPSATNEDVQSRVAEYLRNGHIGNADGATISVDRNTSVAVGAGTASASTVTINYPFSFMVLNPVANLVTRGTSLGSPITLSASAQMRNEAE